MSDRRPAIFALLSVLAATNVSAAPCGVAYVAESKTAMSITGDIELSPDRLRMARRIVLPLKREADARPFETDRGNGSARILRVTKPTNPILLNGNRLCEAPVTWIVVWQMPDRGLGLAAFSGTNVPHSEDSPGLCGTFFYGAAAGGRTSAVLTRSLTFAARNTAARIIVYSVLARRRGRQPGNRKIAVALSVMSIALSISAVVLLRVH